LKLFYVRVNADQKLQRVTVRNMSTIYQSMLM